MIENFLNNGFIILDLVDKNRHDLFSSLIKNKINNLLPHNKLQMRLKKINQYHKLELTNNEHSKVVNPGTRFIEINNLCNIIYDNQILKSIMKHYWGHTNSRIFWTGDLRKHNARENSCGFRIARPGFPKDVGGIHIDKHIGGIKNYFGDDVLIIWIPIRGFDAKYTLNLAPKSHLTSHPDKYIKDDGNYISTVYEDSYVKKFNFIRPKLKLGQCIILSSNILHGGSINNGHDTRISLDIRAYNSNKIPSGFYCRNEKYYRENTCQ